jgi:hypothetical protein
MKPAKSTSEQLAQNAPTAERPRALATLVAIVDQAIAFRFAERTPSLSDVARLVGASSLAAHQRFRRAHQRRKCLRDG